MKKMNLGWVVNGERRHAGQQEESILCGHISINRCYVEEAMAAGGSEVALREGNSDTSAEEYGRVR
jgi:hypothetical protein